MRCLTTHTQVLQVSFEAPPGVKRNLQRTYDAWGPKLISQGSPLQGQLLFMLAWFHAIVQERRAYMSQASLQLACCRSHPSNACRPSEPRWNVHVARFHANKRFGMHRKFVILQPGGLQDSQPACKLLMWPQQTLSCMGHSLTGTRLALG